MSKKEKEINGAPAAEGGKKKLNTKKLKFGSMSAVTIVLVIAIVVVLNLMTSLMMKRYPIKADLTPDNRHEISQETIDVLETLDSNVEITVTSTKDYFTTLTNQVEQYYQYYGMLVDCPFDIIPEILDKYSVYAASSKGSITVNYVDINRDPDFVARINKVYSGEITEGSIVLKCGDRVKVISQTDVQSMITPSKDSTQGNVRMVFAGESIITSAVRAVADLNVVRAAVVTQMDGNYIFDQSGMAIEYSLESFLSKNGYECTQVDISTDDISPEEYDLIAVPAPAVDFSESIIAKLTDFLYNDGNYEKSMVYIPNVATANLPNLSEFLADWKTSVDPSFLWDESHSVQLNQLTAPCVTIADETLSGTIENTALPIVAPFTRAINIVDKNNECIAKPMVTSYDTAFVVPFDENEEQSDKGKFNVIVKSRKERADGLNIFGSNLLVIGSAYMLDDSLLTGTNTYNNANVLINAINDTTGKEASAVIPEKSLQMYTVSLTKGGYNAIKVVTIVVIPLLIAACGFAILLWRKNK